MVSEGTVLKTGIFRATLEDAVDEAGSVTLQPTRRHRLGGADLGCRANAVAVARADSVHKATSSRPQPTAGRASVVGVVVGAARTTTVRRVIGSRHHPMAGLDSAAAVADEVALRLGWVPATDDLQLLC